MEKELSIFAERLKRLREERRMKQTVLSELCGLHRNAVSQYEREEKVPSVEAIAAIADFFEISVDYLLGRANFR